MSVYAAEIDDTVRMSMAKLNMLLKDPGEKEDGKMAENKREDRREE